MSFTIQFKKIFAAVIAVAFFSLTSFAHWNSLGPRGGHVSCSFVADTNIFIGTFSGGLFRSTNGSAVAWKYLNKGMTSGEIRAIIANGSTIIAGTGDQGIFISTDLGVNWAQSNSGLTNTSVSALTYSGTDIFAGTNGGGVFRSTDNGATWSPVITGLSSLNVTSLLVSGATIYAGTIAGIFTTSDNGANWAAANTGLTELNISSIIQSGDNLFAATDNGVFFTPASSISWAEVVGLAGYETTCLTSSAGLVYATTDNGIYSTADDGDEVWDDASTGFPLDVATSISVFGSKLVAGSMDNGIYTATIGSIVWAQTNVTFNNLETYAVVGKNSMVVTATEKGVYVSLDVTVTHTLKNNGLTDYTHVTSLLWEGTNLYAGTANDGFFVTADTATTWVAANTGLTDLDVRAIVVVGSNIVVATGSGKIFSSPLSSISFTEMSVGLPLNMDITALATDGTLLFVGAYGNGVFVTTIGNSWLDANTGLTNLDVTSLAVQGTNLFAGTLGGGVFAASLATPVWTAVNTGLPSLDIYSLAQYNNTYVLAGYKGGVFTTYDSGSNWEVAGINENLPTFGNVIGISFTTTRMLGAIQNNCVYRNNLTELPIPVGINNAPQQNNVVAIYPNPSNGNFRLNYDNTVNVLSISVYDMSGKLVETMANTKQQQFSVQYPKGVYVIEVRTEKETVKQKLVIE